MEKEPKQDLEPNPRLTAQNLQKLKDNGFQYVLVEGFTRDKRLEYVDPSFLLLTPVKDLPEDIKEKGIFESINSTILKDWAEFPDEGIEVLIALNK